MDKSSHGGPTTLSLAITWVLDLSPLRSGATTSSLHSSHQQRHYNKSTHSCQIKAGQVPPQLIPAGEEPPSPIPALEVVDTDELDLEHRSTPGSHGPWNSSNVTLEEEDLQVTSEPGRLHHHSR